MQREKAVFSTVKYIRLNYSSQFLYTRFNRKPSIIMKT